MTCPIPLREGKTMPYMRSGDIDIHYQTTAAEGKPKLLYISGTGGDLRKKPNIFSSPLAKFFDLATFDQRGLGLSGKPDSPYSMADYAQDALNVIDHIGWEKPSVLGVSFGGMVAQELAIEHCDRIDQLVLCCTSSGGAGGSSYPLHTLVTLNDKSRAKKLIGISDLRCTEKWIKSNPEVYQSIIEESLAASQFAAHEPNHSIGAWRQLEARSHHDCYDRLDQITCPTLVCGGSFDGLATPENQQALANAIPNSALELFSGGHMFLLQDKKAFERIVSFLLTPEQFTSGNSR